MYIPICWVNKLSFTCHYFGHAQVSGECGKGLLDRVQHGVLNNLDRQIVVKACSPLGHGIGFRQEAAGEELPIAHLPLDGVLGEDVGAGRIRVAVPVGDHYVLPAVVEDRLRATSGCCDDHCEG